MAKLKERMESPPRKKIQSSTSNVENEVFTVRDSVWLMDELNVVCRSHFGCSPRFSRIRSKTTTLSFTE